MRKIAKFYGMNFAILISVIIYKLTMIKNLKRENTYA